MKQLMLMRNHQLPLNEGLVLAYIYANPNCRQSDWGKAFSMGPTVASPVVLRLVSKGLVSLRPPEPADKILVKRYAVSPKGQLLAKELFGPTQSAGQDVRDFHEKFGLAYNDGPRPLPQELSDLSIHCLYEEVDEYKAAVQAGNLAEQFDALIDLVYFALGRAYLHGFPFMEGWERVHAANMQKTRAVGTEGKRGSSFDVVKPEGWQAPNLDDLVS